MGSRVCGRTGLSWMPVGSSLTSPCPRSLARSGSPTRRRLQLLGPVRRRRPRAGDQRNSGGRRRRTGTRRWSGLSRETFAVACILTTLVAPSKPITPAHSTFLRQNAAQLRSSCGFAKFSSKWRTAFSHLRGGSYNHAVVQARGGTVRRDVPAMRLGPGRLALRRRLTPGPATRRSVVTSPSRQIPRRTFETR